MTQPHSCLASTCSGFFIAASSVGKVAACLCVCDTLTSWLLSMLSGLAMPFCLFTLYTMCDFALISPLCSLHRFCFFPLWRCLSAQASNPSGVHGARMLQGDLKFALDLRKTHLLSLMWVLLRCNTSLLIWSKSERRKTVIFFFIINLNTSNNKSIDR